ncbi:sulfide/dihydroorotate dehydrogenase-like FAD/NAD-binding protein|uniref:Sulfide dehydrogenase (Flavoprotein) subunit SudB n=1 Tax=Dendrosporobacter quercicolus TaxID=146817 RepID=A0A1G9N432_9FIRM|nr:sulfide/dihydroorotate dehydrogenase-like FAD/NAD-binding protein [Dendrosporobacter quercicolus]NSL47222.1 sulfide/dihydroorotate dehydrogenase-like FAD/NAD-binding protein [Dendrosporobacter quercicolus DSM 1736]SDL81144.1 sulfide dehydrogenase (flavoprotein) subunit SudB [Dendrosporobacter quercicolus]
MYKILVKKELAPSVQLFELSAPRIARKAQPGQFVIVRLNEEGERVPLTIADFDRAKGTVTIIFQEVGASTKAMGLLNEGDALLDVVGPLGKPTHIENFGTVVCIGGGIGIAPVYPIARGLKQAGNKVISIIGARSKDILILEDEMKAVSDQLLVTTDDGSKGQQGFVTDQLKQLIDAGVNIALVVAIGPVIMMRSVAEVTRPYAIETVVSLNPIMVDGTGMCGGCRVQVGAESKFACVDGPEFDAHQVDFAGLMARQKMYLPQEKHHQQHCSDQQGGSCKCHSH